jgi:hypothetical protein
MERAPKLIIPGAAPGEPSRKPRVAIAVPSSDQVHANFAMALAACLYANGIRRQPVALINTKGSAIHKNRDNAVLEARRLECDHILFLDSDITFPPDALQRLLAHGKPIVGATYARRTAPHANLAKPKDGQGADVSGLTEVDALPTGHLLIELAVFVQMKRPWFRFVAIEEGAVLHGIPGPETLGEDYGFCEAARALGYAIWMDTDLSFDLVHWGECGWKLREGAAPAGDPLPFAEMVELQPS